MPVPVRVLVCGVPVALVATLRVAVYPVRTRGGLKVTAMVQLVLAASVLLQVPPVTTAKLAKLVPVMLIAPIVSDAVVLVFDSVAVMALLVVPSG